MGEKWIRADKLAEEWKMTAIQFVDHLKNDEHVKRNGLTPHNDKLTSINEVAIGNLGAIYFLSTEIMAIEKERCETNELYRTALKSKDPYDKEHVRPLLRHCGLSDADMDALLTEVEPQSDTVPETTEKKDLPGSRVNERLALALEFAKQVKKNHPELTRKEAAKQINLWLAKEYSAKSNIAKGYSEKHLMKLIAKDFKPGKRGNPGKNPKNN